MLILLKTENVTKLLGKFLYFPHFQLLFFPSPSWMIINCPKSCDRCELRDPKVRCPRSALNMSTEPIYTPNHMNTMFENIISKFGKRYKVNVLSTTPWVVTFDDFLSSKEIKALIKTQKKWERSTDTGSTNDFGEWWV